MTLSESEIKILATRLQDVFTASQSTHSISNTPLPAEELVPVAFAWILIGHKLSPSEYLALAFEL